MPEERTLKYTTVEPLNLASYRVCLSLVAEETPVPVLSSEDCTRCYYPTEIVFLSHRQYGRCCLYTPTTEFLYVTHAHVHTHCAPLHKARELTFVCFQFEILMEVSLPGKDNQ
jgi:hypothetical protein